MQDNTRILKETRDSLERVGELKRTNLAEREVEMAQLPSENSKHAETRSGIL